METKIISQQLFDLDETRIRRNLTLKYGALATPAGPEQATPTAPQDPASLVIPDQSMLPSPTGEDRSPDEAETERNGAACCPCCRIRTLRPERYQ
jgi:hypothetical protein